MARATTLFLLVLQTLSRVLTIWCLWDIPLVRLRLDTLSPTLVKLEMLGLKHGMRMGVLCLLLRSSQRGV
jgi:hypothetical protein